LVAVHPVGIVDKRVPAEVGLYELKSVVAGVYGSDVMEICPITILQNINKIIESTNPLFIKVYYRVLSINLEALQRKLDQYGFKEDMGVIVRRKAMCNIDLNSGKF